MGCYVRLKFLHESAVTTAGIAIMPTSFIRRKPKYRGRKLDGLREGQRRDEGYMGISKQNQPTNKCTQVWQTAKQGGNTQSAASFATKDVKGGAYKGWNTPSTVRQDAMGNTVKGDNPSRMRKAGD